MLIDLSDVSWQMLMVALKVGVPSFFAGWFAHMVWDWLISPPGKDKG